MTDALDFSDRSFEAATFRNCAMSGAAFQDVAMAGARFDDVNLRHARFRDVDLTGASIEDATIDGLRILGHDVQALIARRGAAAANTLAAEPQLFVSDLNTAVRFYVDGLGFEVGGIYGEPAFYAQVVRDGARLNLRVATGPVFAAGFRDRETDALSATLTLDEAEPLFLEFETRGAIFHQRFRNELWGARTFIVRDPDGNLIAFAGADVGDRTTS